MREVISLTTTETPIQTATIGAALAPADRTLIFRLVGFYEYIQALHHFDVLVKQTNAQEREMIDEIIRQHDEFAVYTNLSRQLQRGESSLMEKAKDGKDKFERRGLAWAMALARVEVAAMLASYTQVRSPFEAVQPTEFEWSAYKELLEDGTRTHYWALYNDPQFPRVIAQSRREPNAQTVAYVRRLSVARAFHDAATRIGSGNHTQTQLAELASWKLQLDTSQKVLANNIEQFLESTLAVVQTGSGPSKSTTGPQRTYAYACGAQLRGERYELQQGTARVEVEKF